MKKQTIKTITKIIPLLLLISFLMPSLVLAFDYEPNKPLAQYKSEGILLGVCSGLAREFGGEPTYFRMGFILFSMAGGSGLLAYILMAILMDERN